MLSIDKFLEYLRSELNRSQRTVENYREDLKLFEQYARNLSESFTWESVDSDMIRNWMEHMIDAGNKATSVNRRLSALKMFYRFALVRHYVESDPAHSLKGPKESKPLPQFLKENEMDELLDRKMWGDDYDNVRARTIIILFYETGMRVSELVSLEDEMVDFVNRQLKVTGKRNKQRIIPFGEELEQALRDYIAVRDEQVDRQENGLFLTGKGRRMNVGQVRRVVETQLGRVTTQKKRSPHVLRHSFATAMLNHEAGLESVRKLLGHESLATTEIYTHTTFEQLKKVDNKAHPRS